MRDSTTKAANNIMTPITLIEVLVALLVAVIGLIGVIIATVGRLAEVWLKYYLANAKVEETSKTEDAVG